MLWLWSVLACEHERSQPGVQIGDPSTSGTVFAHGRLRVLSGAGILAGQGVDAAFFELIGATDEDRLGEYLHATGDVDGDGLGDLVLTAGGVLLLLPGAVIAAGGSANTSDLVAVNGPGPCAGMWGTGDVTGDGVQDVIATYGHDGPFHLYSGAGLAGAEPEVARFVRGAEGWFGVPGPAGDVNGDGVSDLLVFREGAGAGTSESPDGANQAILFGPFAGDHDVDAADVVITDVLVEPLGDVDADGRSDLAALYPYGGGDGPDSDLRVFLGSEVSPRPAIGPGDAHYVISGETYVTWVLPVGDLDGDGHAEVWVNLRVGDPHTDVFSGTALSGRTFGTADLTFGADYPGGVLLSDLDGDGDREVVAQRWTVSGEVQTVYVYDGLALDGRTVHESEAGVTWVISPGTGVPLVDVGDVDGDGAHDLALGEPEALPAE